MFRRHSLLLGILSFALLIRLWVWFDVQDAPYWKVPIVDEKAQWQLALDWRSGRAPEQGAYYFAPGYAYFLGLVQAAGGTPVSAKACQMILGVLTCAVIWYITKTYTGRTAATLAAGLWSLYPAAILFEVLLLKPAWTLFLTTTSLALLLGGRKPEALRWCTAGLGFGLAALLRGELLLVACVIGIVAFVARYQAWPKAPASLGSPALFVLLVLLCLAYPTWENYKNGGGFVILAYGGGTNFYIGNHAGATGSYEPLLPDRSDPRVEEKDAVALATKDGKQPLGPRQVSNYWWNRGLQWWRQSPLDALRLSAKKLLLLWGPAEQPDALSTQVAGRWLRLLGNPVVGPGLILPLAVVGLFLWRKRRDIWPLGAYLLGTTLALVPFFIFERFRLGLIAVCLPFASATVLSILQQCKRKRWHAAAFLTGCVVLVGWTGSLAKVDRYDEILRVNVGNMLFDAGRYTEALREYRHVEQEVPEAWRIGINIANVQAALGRPSEALTRLQTVIDKLREEGETTGMPPRDELAYCHETAGDLALRLARFDNAVQHYEAALEFADNLSQPRLQAKRLQAELRSR